MAPVLAQLLQDFPEVLRIAYRHFPLVTIHDKATLAAQAAEAAGLQGQFFAMHNALYENLSTWGTLDVPGFETWLANHAGELGMDKEQFETDLNSEAIVSKVQGAYEAASQIGLPGTPTFVIDGQYYDGPSDYNTLSAIINLLTLADKQFKECPEITIDPLNQYIATIKTEKGDIVVELYPEEAPFAVNSFIFLAENNWYDNVTFHRVLPGFMAQAGDPTGTGYGGPGYAFDIEVSTDLTFDKPGLFAMANAGPNSNGSQFFITFTDTHNLDGQYTIFGEVIEGMEVVESLTPRDPSQSPDLPPGDLILDVIIEEN
jgi:cyclophilin family peptidyl-prolyl cis-trans isomerase